MPLPKFRYHPDPLATGSIKPSTAVCDCCGEARGFEYTASFYTRQKPKPILCPWCIESGDAARKYDGAFSDDYPLQDLAPEIVQEVCQRTPGYNSWQQEVWQSHCNDACEFLGDAELEELRALAGDDLAAQLKRSGMKDQHWTSLVAKYQKGGSPAVYKFACRHCRTVIYPIDFS